MTEGAGGVGLAGAGQPERQDVDRPVEEVTPRQLFERAATIGCSADAVCRLSRSARVRPYVVLGLVEGFELVSVRRGSLLWDLGFCAGDVAMAVDGQRLDSPVKALTWGERLERLTDGSPLEVSVLRGREVITLRYVLR